jgi:hypothetical protein
MAEINLIKIDGKPIQKLVEVISNGIGTVYKPRAIRKEAEAEAYKIEIIERAKAKALSEGKIEEAETYCRIQERLLHTETIRQKNIDTVSQIAAEQLAQEQTVSEEPVDKDWTARFFSIVEDVSDEEMQNLWGRVLAGEVKQPKSYSLRTLELIKNLTKDEAHIFMKVANFCLTSNNDSFIYKGDYDEIRKDYGISYSDIAQLVEIGLIQPGDFVSYQLLQSPSAVKTYFISGNIAIVVEKKENVPTIQFPINLFTKAGTELLKLVKPNPPFDYLAKFAKAIKRENVEVKHGLLLEKTPTYIRHTQPLQDFPE